jgi:hypothetical protein
MTDSQKMGYEQVRVEELKPGDTVLVSIPVDTGVISIEGTRVTVRHLTAGTMHVLYFDIPTTVWRRVEAIDDG